MNISKMKSDAEIQAEQDKEIRNQKLRDKWMPRFNMCFAYTACFFYFGIRVERTTVPGQLQDLWTDKLFHSMAVLSAFIVTGIGLVIGVYLKKQLTGRAIDFPPNFGLDLKSLRLRYETPFLFTILFVIVMEIVIYFLNH